MEELQNTCEVIDMVRFNIKSIWHELFLKEEEQAGHLPYTQNLDVKDGHVRQTFIKNALNVIHRVLIIFGDQLWNWTDYETKIIDFHI